MDQEHFYASWQTSAYANYAVISGLDPPLKICLSAGQKGCKMTWPEANPESNLEGGVQSHYLRRN